MALPTCPTPPNERTPSRARCQLAVSAISLFDECAVPLRQMPRSLGVWCTKRELYLAVSDDGVLADVEPQRIRVADVLDATGRLTALMSDVQRLLDELQPDEVRLLQPEQRYEAPYSEFAPKLALETVVRLACDVKGIPVDVLHRATARSRMKFDRKGSLDSHIDANVDRAGKYWNDGRKYAAVAALARESD